MRQPEEKVDLNRFRVRPDKPILASEDERTVCYGRHGQQLAVDDDRDCFCKTEQSPATGRIVYLVRFGLAGVSYGQPADPTDDENRENTFEFRKVPKPAFDAYL